jgi:hydroxylaminobenzene mutase
LFTSFEGFAIPYFEVPNLGRSVHTLSGFVGVLFLALGLVWPRLNLGAAGARVAFWFLIYSALATIAGFLIAGVWGAGSSIIPLAAGGARERFSGDGDPDRNVSRGADGDYFVCAHSLGPSPL